MPPLSRRTSRLLTRVENKPHARQSDHHDPLPTPPATNSTRSSDSQSKTAAEQEVDIYADPKSSEDEAEPETPAPAFGRPSALDGAEDAQPAKAQFKSLARSKLTAPEIKETKATFRQPTRPHIRSPESTRSKRSNDSDDQGNSDLDGMLFSSQGSSKRQKGIARPNIHAAPARPKVAYGKAAKRRENTASERAKRKKEEAEQREAAKPKQPTFKHLPADMYEFEGPRKEFAMPKDSANVEAGAGNSLSPSLSSLSSPPDSPGVEEVKGFQLPAAVPYCATVQCAICGAAVEKRMKEDFEDTYVEGKAMNFRWQQRFCDWHKKQTAQASWADKGYPAIDWQGLEKRMRRFDKHLKDVICDRVASRWKQDLREDLRPARPKGEESGVAAAADNVKTARAGYYGPRGERVMAEHIVARLSDELRGRASKDAVVAAAGVKGGISGFVHAVLVPELACRLIMEDLDLDSDKASVVLGESTEVGVLLNPDVDEDVAGNSQVDDREVKD